MTIMCRVKHLEEKCQQLTANSNQDEIANTLKETQMANEEYKRHQKRILEIENQLSNIDLTIGLFCDEIVALYEHLPKIFDYNDLTDLLARKFAELMCKGFSFHILRGRPLRCLSKLIQLSLQYVYPSTNKSPLVLTVIGEQSSAKSSLLNATFGCNFRVSAGRCTIGMYLSVVRWRNQTIVILDTEGLLSLEESGSIFDNQMVSLAMLSSHFVLINHKGEFSSNLEHLIGMSFYAKLQIRSLLKPKLLFVLRDQADTNATVIFHHQLVKLKENLCNDSKFLKSSVDDEIKINNENVLLLPNAFSSDYNSILKVTQTWRNRTFPMKINDLRDVILRSLLDADAQIYEDVPQLFQKIACNWNAIDKLGPNLLACKTLYELSVMNELRDIARQIIEKAIKALNEEGRQNINNVLSIFASENCSNLDADALGSQFQAAMQVTCNKIIERAFAAYGTATEQSCFAPEIKQKVKKLIEPPVLNMQGMLREEFDDRLYKMRREVRVSNAQRRLLETMQQELNQNVKLAPKSLHERVETVYALECQTCLQTLQQQLATSEQITSRILKFYNSTLQATTANTTKGSIYNLLHIQDTHQFQQVTQSLGHVYICVIYHEGTQQQSETSRSCRWKISRRSKKPGANLEMPLEEIFTSISHWFCNRCNNESNRKLLRKIIDRLLPQLRDDIQNLVNNQSLSFTDPRMITHIFTYIDNLYRDQTIQKHLKDLEPHEFLSGIAVIALKMLIIEILHAEQFRYEEDVKKVLSEINTWRENIKIQINHMQDSLEQGKNLAKVVGEQIFKIVGGVLADKILHDVTEEIAKSHFINHDAVQKQAYEESFGQGNGEKILKYVLDINRYFCELGLREISTKVEAIMYMHTRDVEQIILKIFNLVDDVVQRSERKNVRSIVDEIEEGIASCNLLEMNAFNSFSLINILSVSIQNLANFKQGFRTVRDHLQNIQDRVTTLMCCVKAKTYAGCKRRISRRLGCQSRCPGCGAKCGLPEAHDEELVEQWHECKDAQKQCKCVRSPSVFHKVHRTSHHLAESFSGTTYYKTNTPYLGLCYQHWLTIGVRLSDEEIIFPRKKYYNQRHPEWYNNLQKLSTTGDACNEDHPPAEQRRGWMIVRRVLVSYYSSLGMIDQEQYDEKLYPSKIEELPADFQVKWDDMIGESEENKDND